MPLKSLFMKPRYIKYRSSWREVEVALVGAMLYHIDGLADAKKFLALDDSVCEEFFTWTFNK